MHQNTQNYNSNIHFGPPGSPGGAPGGGGGGGPKSSRGGGRALLTTKIFFSKIPWLSLGHKNTVRMVPRWFFSDPLLSLHPIFGHSKMALLVPERKFQDHFYKPNIPQKWWISHLNLSLIISEWILDRISFLAFWGYFWADFRRWKSQNVKVRFCKVRSPQIKKCKKTN